jgi:hypothetical protein
MYKWIKLKDARLLEAFEKYGHLKYKKWKQVADYVGGGCSSKQVMKYINQLISQLYFT